jgi:hypothetical protein
VCESAYFTAPTRERARSASDTRIRYAAAGPFNFGRRPTSVMALTVSTGSERAADVVTDLLVAPQAGATNATASPAEGWVSDAPAGASRPRCSGSTRSTARTGSEASGARSFQRTPAPRANAHRFCFACASGGASRTITDTRSWSVEGRGRMGLGRSHLGELESEQRPTASQIRTSPFPGSDRAVRAVAGPRRSVGYGRLLAVERMRKQTVLVIAKGGVRDRPGSDASSCVQSSFRRPFSSRAVGGCERARPGV